MVNRFVRLTFISMKQQLSALLVNLDEAKSELESLINEANGSSINEDQVMRRYYEIFKHLSLAWNSREMTLDELNSLDTQLFDKLGSTLPPLGPRFHF